MSSILFLLSFIAERFTVAQQCSNVSGGNSTSAVSSLCSRDYTPFPTRQQCYQAVVPGQPPRDKTLLWTDYYHHVAREYAERYGLVTVTMPEVWRNQDFFKETEYHVPGYDNDDTDDYE